MSLTRIDENELLAPLHQGPLKEAGWLVFLARLRRRTNACYAGLLHGRSEGSSLQASEFFVAQPGETAAPRGWQEAFHRHTPLPHRRLRAGRAYGGSDFPDPTDPAHAAYARDVMAPAGFVDQRVVRVSEAGGACFWLMVARRDGELGATDSALLSALAPHLEIALRTTVAITQARRRAAISEQAAARLGLGWMTLNGLGQTIEAGGRVLPAALHNGLPTTVATARSTRLGEEPGFDLRIEPIADPASVADPAAMVYVRESGVCGHDAPGALVDLHGLSRNEARLAWALCQGESIASAARAIGLTLETARNYSKRIYAKVGASGQADLVRIILNGVAMMG